MVYWLLALLVCGVSGGGAFAFGFCGINSVGMLISLFLLLWFMFAIVVVCWFRSVTELVGWLVMLFTLDLRTCFAV